MFTVLCQTVRITARMLCVLVPSLRATARDTREKETVKERKYRHAIGASCERVRV